MNKGINYELPYEDVPSADVLWSYKTEETLGKRPKATTWFKDFKILAPAAVMAQTDVLRRLGNRTIRSVVRIRDNRRA